MPGSSESRDDKASPAETLPVQEPSPGVSGLIARYALQLLAIVGGGGVGITGAVVATGLFVHTGHLAMLGLPLFPMSPLAYSELARRFFMDTARISVSPSWPTAAWLAGALIFAGLFAAYPSLSRRRCLQRGGVLYECTHSPLACPACLLAIVVVGGLVLAQSTAALTRGYSTGLLWPRSAVDDEEAFGVEPSGLLLSDRETRWCLFNRMPADATTGELDDSHVARARLDGYYRWLVGATTLLLLLYIVTWRVRRRATASHAGQFGGERASLLAASNLLLEIPAVAILALLLITLPAAYGALTMTTTYPTVSMEGDALQGTASRGFLMSPATSDATSVCVLRLEASEGRYSGYVLETHRLDPRALMQGGDYGDILQAAQVQMEAELAQADKAKVSEAQAQLAADAASTTEAGAEPTPVPW